MSKKKIEIRKAGKLEIIDQSDELEFDEPPQQKCLCHCHRNCQGYTDKDKGARCLCHPTSCNHCTQQKDAGWWEAEFEEYKDLITKKVEIHNLENGTVKKPVDAIKALLVKVEIQARQQERAESYTKGFNEGYRSRDKELPKSYQRGSQQAIDKIVKWMRFENEVVVLNKDEWEEFIENLKKEKYGK